MFNYITPRPHKLFKSKDRAIGAGSEVKPSPKLVLPGELRWKVGVKKNNSDALIMENL